MIRTVSCPAASGSFGFAEHNDLKIGLRRVISIIQFLCDIVPMSRQ